MGNGAHKRKTHCRNDDNIVDGFAKADVGRMRGGGG